MTHWRQSCWLDSAIAMGKSSFGVCQILPSFFSSISLSAFLQSGVLSFHLHSEAFSDRHYRERSGDNGHCCGC